MRYEGIYILKEKLTEEERNKTIENLKKCVEEVGKLNEIGLKKLAYEVKGNKKGYYIQIIYISESCQDIEKQAKLDDNILKFINIHLAYDEYENLLNDYGKETIIDLEFKNELISILDKYTENDWEEDPLDVNDVDCLVNILRNQLNLLNGNITVGEYLETM